MENPSAEISSIIHLLTQTPPSTQRKTIETFFTSDAAFTHPFCRTGSFDGSRFLIRAIYRWYKIMSPRIDLDIESVAYDAHNLLLYVSIHQIFRIQFVPFFRAPVRLTTVLKLRQDPRTSKYLIASQNDLYQVNEFAKFVWPGGWVVLWMWQIGATLACLTLAALFWPMSWWEEHGSDVKVRAGIVEGRVEDRVKGVEGRLRHAAMPEEAVFEKREGRGEMVTKPAVEMR